MSVTPFFQDEYQGAPMKRVLAHVLRKRDLGMPVVGNYCAYAPVELVHAMGGVPAVLCAFSNATIPKAEETLPANLCPLVKSSFGFIQAGTCPFFELTAAVIAETTCDGKKKMFELIGEKRPLFVMDLPQKPDEEGALEYWTASMRKVRAFLERTFDRKIADADIEAALRDSNAKNELVRTIFSFAAQAPPVVRWDELYDVSSLASVATGADIGDKLRAIVANLAERVANRPSVAPGKKPRVLVTGTPWGGDALKVFKIIEEEGGAIVGLDSCTGRKPFVPVFEEGSGDPLRSLARRYLEIPCSCMTPNDRRLDELSNQIREFKPDVVIDLVLQACHTYGIESTKVERRVRGTHGIPFLKLVTDYSGEDVGQLRTRIGALLEMAGT